MGVIDNALQAGFVPRNFVAESSDVVKLRMVWVL